MSSLKFINDFQFVNDLSKELQHTMGRDYLIEKNKLIGDKEIDIYIKNSITGSTFSIEVKGTPKDVSLPLEILPWIQKLKNNIKEENNNFIVLSIPDVTENVKSNFQKRDMKIFEYPQHKENLMNDLADFIKKLEKQV
jgi:hypothetical protein